MVKASCRHTTCKLIWCKLLFQHDCHLMSHFHRLAASVIINSMNHCIEHNRRNRPVHNSILARINTTSPFAHTSMVIHVHRHDRVIWKRPAVIYNSRNTCQAIRVIIHRTAPHRIVRSISPHRSNHKRVFQ